MNCSFNSVDMNKILSCRISLTNDLRLKENVYYMRLAVRSSDSISYITIDYFSLDEILNDYRMINTFLINKKEN